MSRRTLADGFASYRRDVIPNDAPPVQVEECRRAFFAGGWYALQTMVGLEEAVQGVSREEGDKMIDEAMDALVAEAEAFARSVCGTRSDG